MAAKTRWLVSTYELRIDGRPAEQSDWAQLRRVPIGRLGDVQMEYCFETESISGGPPPVPPLISFGG